MRLEPLQLVGFPWTNPIHRRAAHLHHPHCLRPAPQHHTDLAQIHRLASHAQCVEMRKVSIDGILEIPWFLWSQREMRDVRRELEDTPHVDIWHVVKSDKADGR